MHPFDFSETFITVVDQLSFAKAARKLQIAPSVVTRRINLLEQHLKVQLLVRTTRKLSVTSAGELFYKQMKHVVSDWHDACASIQADAETLSGKLCVAMSAPLSSLLRSSVLAFTQQHQQIELACYQTQTHIDLLAENVDVMIGPTHLIYDTDGIIARPIGRSASQLFASPAYLSKHGTPKKLEDLKNHRRILWKRRDQKEQAWQFEGSQIKHPANLIFNDWETVLQAAIQGEGIILLPPVTCHQAITDKLITPVLPEQTAPATSLYVFYAKRQFTPANIRAFVQHILDSEITALYQQFYAQKITTSNHTTATSYNS